MRYTRIDIKGQKFGRLVVKEHVDRDSAGNATWLCLCDCGNYKIVAAYKLKVGTTKSCGCLQKENVSKANRKHGAHGTPEYNAYLKAKERCTNERNKAWKDYGGRGIKFNFTSFEEFLLELGPRPQGLSLDRINNNGNYEIGNCKWSTRLEQHNNRRQPQAPIIGPLDDGSYERFCKFCGHREKANKEGI